MSESPIPGRSGAITVWFAATADIDGRHIRKVSAYPVRQQDRGPAPRRQVMELYSARNSGARRDRLSAGRDGHRNDCRAKQRKGLTIHHAIASLVSAGNRALIQF